MINWDNMFNLFWDYCWIIQHTSSRLQTLASSSRRTCADVFWSASLAVHRNMALSPGSPYSEAQCACPFPPECVVLPSKPPRMTSGWESFGCPPHAGHQRWHVAIKQNPRISNCHQRCHQRSQIPDPPSLTSHFLLHINRNLPTVEAWPKRSNPCFPKKVWTVSPQTRDLWQPEVHGSHRSPWKTDKSRNSGSDSLNHCLQQTSKQSQKREDHKRFYTTSNIVTSYTLHISSPGQLHPGGRCNGRLTPLWNHGLTAAQLWPQEALGVAQRGHQALAGGHVAHQLRDDQIHPFRQRHLKSLQWHQFEGLSPHWSPLTCFLSYNGY